MNVFHAILTLFIILICRSAFGQVPLSGQDTLVYKGLVMTRCNNLYVWFGGNGTEYKNTWPSDNGMVITDHWVAVDSSLDYYSAMNSGIYFTSTYLGYDLDKNRFRFRELSKNHGHTKIFKNNYQRDYYYTNVVSVTTGDVWKDHQGYGVEFYVIECEFKYVPYRKETFCTANINANKAKHAFIEYSTMTYFITEVISMKLIEIEGPIKLKLPKHPKLHQFPSN